MEHTSVKPLTNRSMPETTIIPVLHYSNVSKAIDWLCNTFGFTERWRAGNHRAQLSFGNGAIAISERHPSTVSHPDKNSPLLYSLMIRVADVESHYKHAVQMGALILQEPMDFPYGERQYTVEDAGGYQWTFSQSIADLAPEEWGGTTARPL